MITRLAADDVQRLAVRALSLDADALGLEAPESLAALIRRTASFISPCSPRTLREVTLRALRGIVVPPQRSSEADLLAWRQTRALIEATVESLAAYGDLLELPSTDDERERMYYLAPPTFVPLSNGIFFLLGGHRDAVDALPEELRKRIEYCGHTRRITAEPNETLTDRLKRFGLVELPGKYWLAGPRSGSPSAEVARAEVAISGKATRGDIAGLTVIDLDRSPTFYPARWRDPRGLTGRFVGRREQLYGADLWVYVELANGQPTRLLDLPLDSKTPDQRGCDDAWQLQLAIDSIAGHPQRYRLRRAPPTGTVIVDLLSPIPRWARRRFDVLGELVAPMRSVLAYRFKASMLDEVRNCLEQELWLLPE